MCTERSSGASSHGSPCPMQRGVRRLHSRPPEAASNAEGTWKGLHAMNRSLLNRSLLAPLARIPLALALAASLAPAACHIAPKAESRESFKTETEAAKTWFSSNVKSFDRQIGDSGGYIIFPSVGQAGAVFFGGAFGRGAVFNGSGTQVGWAALSRGSFGLQLGAQGFKMAMILEDEATMRRFKDGKWTGDVSATAVAANEGAAADAQFTDGVIVYVGDQSGLMAGISIALANVRYKNIDDVE